VFFREKYLHDTVLYILQMVDVSAVGACEDGASEGMQCLLLRCCYIFVTVLLHCCCIVTVMYGLKNQTDLPHSKVVLRRDGGRPEFSLN
jgi:hypothetical protein